MFEAISAVKISAKMNAGRFFIIGINCLRLIKRLLM